MLLTLKHHFKGRYRLDLRRLILLLSLISVLLVLANSVLASFRVQRQVLIANTLEANHAYATKLSSSVEVFVVSARQQLAFSANQIRDHFGDRAFLVAETKRIKQQNQNFNSAVIVNKDGLVLATDPDLGITGIQLDSEGSLQARSKRKPLISPPFVATTGRLLITLSHPIFDRDNNYLGYVGGTIYLDQPSILNRLIGDHFHRDGSYIYVVDRARRLLYHPTPARIGTQVGDNPVIDAVLAGGSGTMEITNSEGIDMLAGYAAIPGTGWGIVSQRPTKVTLAPLNELVRQVLFNALPLTLLIAIFIWWFARLIAQPLRGLAESAGSMDQPESTTQIKQTPAWYFETAHLKTALLAGIELLQTQINRLHTDVQTDPLTGLQNRRALTSALASYSQKGTPLTVIALDIDHFKRVNDTYGHDVGDNVLQHLAVLMRSCARHDDLLCRTGGEEFIILAPRTDTSAARDIAERLRSTVENSPVAPVGQITVSLGIAQWPTDTHDMQQLLKLADDMLYCAKRNGRNRVEWPGRTD